MDDTATYSPFRMQTYRLAWLCTFAIFGIVVLMWVLDHGANGILAEVGFGLFFAASLFSLLSRRLGPFAAALGGAALLAGSICA